MIQQIIKILIVYCVLFFSIGMSKVQAQFQQSNADFKKASKKVEKGLQINNRDTLAQGYFDLGENYFRKGDWRKSEEFYTKARTSFEKIPDAAGVAKSSRALGKVLEELNRPSEAISSYSKAVEYNQKNGNVDAGTFNSNDITRLSKPDSLVLQRKILNANIGLGLKNKDTIEIISNYGRMGELRANGADDSLKSGAYKNAYQFAKNIPLEALRYNQLLTDAYVKEKNFAGAIEAKKEIIREPFVQNSSQTRATEITSLAEIYLSNNDTQSALELLKQSYNISVTNGHLLEARKCIAKLDSIYESLGNDKESRQLYKDFLGLLPGIIARDSSLTDNQLIAETEQRLQLLERDKAIKDELIDKKNRLNYWLLITLSVLAIFVSYILYILKKLRIKNKKIALQSLRREMNPHFIFNSLNSINQFIANNNELEANQYLTKFSTLMRSVMENSKDDFVLFSKEAGLLQNYLELEKSRFQDKFNFSVEIDDSLFTEDRLFMPGMLIQPHLENAIWHGLRYMDEKGFLTLRFIRKEKTLVITIEDNGIGMLQSKKLKTINQKKHEGRGISNTLERIKILNELYRQDITCDLKDKLFPEHGVIVQLIVPLLKDFNHEN